MIRRVNQMLWYETHYSELFSLSVIGITIFNEIRGET